MFGFHLVWFLYWILFLVVWNILRKLHNKGRKMGQPTKFFITKDILECSDDFNKQLVCLFTIMHKFSYKIDFKT